MINGIMIQWVNSLGGLEEYLFTYNQEVEEIADTGLVIIPPINEDIADVNTAIERQVEKTTQLITCFADHLTKDEIRQLHYIKYSECVWVWLTKNPTFPKGLFLLKLDSLITLISLKLNYTNAKPFRNNSK
jgi:hypothetical protein